MIIWQLLKVVPRIIFTGIDRYHIVKLPLDRDLDDLPRSVEGVTFEWITHANVDKIEKWVGRSTVWFWRRLLNLGDAGIYALVDGEVVGYNLISLGCEHWAVYHVKGPVGRHDAYFHRGATHPSFRRRGIMTAMLVRSAEYLQQNYGAQEFQRACGANLTSNHAQTEVVEQIGFVKTHELHITRLFMICFARRYWELDPESGERIGRGKLGVSFKLPGFLLQTKKASVEQPVTPFGTP